MTYDLGDAATWEFFFPKVDKPLLIVPGEDIRMPIDDDNEGQVRIKGLAQ
jgi:hypothetical protein